MKTERLHRSEGYVCQIDGSNVEFPEIVRIKNWITGY